MEPVTYRDLWVNFLQHRAQLAAAVLAWSTCVPPDVPPSSELIGNLNYATAMCRVHYLRVPAKIPASLPEQAEYWKRFYNSELGAGTAREYVSSWRRFVPADLVYV